MFGILPMMERNFLVKENWVIQEIAMYIGYSSD